jgi:hypothetical protein
MCIILNNLISHILSSKRGQFSYYFDTKLERNLQAVILKQVLKVETDVFIKISMF